MIIENHLKRFLNVTNPHVTFGFIPLCDMFCVDAKKYYSKEYSRIYDVTAFICFELNKKSEIELFLIGIDKNGEIFR